MGGAGGMEVAVASGSGDFGAGGTTGTLAVVSGTEALGAGGATGRLAGETGGAAAPTMDRREVDNPTAAPTPTAMNAQMASTVTRRRVVWPVYNIS